ncbi:hypothetical protein [Lactiplantibacillus plantarum]|uniref:hypothetical protein n=1 Tax=Lactiplantibacillus plantarum TaxID=1590 RepID=UPI002072AE98|nr:hypothetical protein [Lactiplantibacillus plantarum]
MKDGLENKQKSKDNKQSFRIFDKYGSFVLLDEEGTQEEIQLVNDYTSSAALYDQRKLVGLEK